jgi:hypothetical protein
MNLSHYFDRFGLDTPIWKTYLAGHKGGKECR